MPTGLTGSIYDGKPTTLRDFALRCARMFGPLISMRDHDLDAPIPDVIEPMSADHYRKRLDEAVTDFAHAEALTEEQAAFEAADAHEHARAEIRKMNTEKAERRERYEAMLAEVNAWQPPTPDHEGLKAFMVEQLTSSIKGDGRPLDVPALETGAAYKAGRIAQARRDITYYEKRAAEDEQHARDATRWIGALKASLPGATEPGR